MFPFRRILVALAGNGTDSDLLDYAAMLGAHARGAQIRCVHVAPSAAALHDSLAFREIALERLRGAASANDVTCEWVEGEREDRLLEIAAARRADVILLGHRPARSGRRSLARRLAMKAPCSVWMAPEGSPPSLHRILAPTDFSRRSADAVALATALAESVGLDECYALHVYFNEAAVTYQEYGEVIDEQHDRAFCLFVAPIDLHGVHLKPLFVEGSIVAHTVNRVAAELGADLVVMGTRGRSRSAAALLGSETEHAIRETGRPILVVKHFGASLRLVGALLDRRRRAGGSARFT